MLSPLRGIIWDMDGTLYRFTPAQFAACERASAETAVQLGVPLDMEACCAIARAGMLATGYHWHYFVQDYGLQLADFHGDFLRRVDEKAVVERTWELADIFPENLHHFILTHSSREIARRIMRHLGLERIFDDENILAFEDIDYTGKDESLEAFQKALDRLCLPPSAVAVVEDTPRNLVNAHALGMTTVFLHHGKPLQPLPSHIDLQYENPVDFLETLQEQAA